MERKSQPQHNGNKMTSLQNCGIVDVFQSPFAKLFQNSTYLAWHTPTTSENWLFASLWKLSQFYVLYLCAWPRCHFGQRSHFFCSCNQPYTILLLSPTASQGYSQICSSLYHGIHCSDVAFPENYFAENCPEIFQKFSAEPEKYIWLRFSVWDDIRKFMFFKFL